MTSRRESASGPPNCSAIATARFFSISNFAASDSLRFSSSLPSAAFASHSSFAFATASATNCEFPARRFMTSVCLIESMPSSWSMTDMLPPSAVAASMLDSRAERACTGSAFHASENSRAVIPAVDAHISSDPVTLSISFWVMSLAPAMASPARAMSLSICAMIVLMAVPPASASTPIDASAVARPRMSAWDMCTCVPAAAMRIAIDDMSDSVVAKLFPSPTMAEP